MTAEEIEATNSEYAKLLAGACGWQEARPLSLDVIAEAEGCLLKSEYHRGSYLGWLMFVTRGWIGVVSFTTHSCLKVIRATARERAQALLVMEGKLIYEWKDDQAYFRPYLRPL